MWWHTVTHGKGKRKLANGVGSQRCVVESSWNVMAHGDAREREEETGEWSGYPVLFTLPRNMVYPALLPLMRTARLPVVEWTEAPTDLNGLVLFSERRNLVSARVPSHFRCSQIYTAMPWSWTCHEIPSFIKMAVWYYVLRQKVAFVAETCRWWLITNKVFL